MANIEEYARIVETERYGKDVRQAIADGLRAAGDHSQKVTILKMEPENWVIDGSKEEGGQTLYQFHYMVNVPGISSDTSKQMIMIQPVDAQSKQAYSDFGIKCMAQLTDYLYFKSTEWTTDPPSEEIRLSIFTQLLDRGVANPSSTIEYIVTPEKEVVEGSKLPVESAALYDKFRSCMKKSYINVTRMDEVLNIPDALKISRGSLVKNMNVVYLSILLEAKDQTNGAIIDPYIPFLGFKATDDKYGIMKPSHHIESPCLMYRTSWIDFWPVYDPSYAGFYSTEPRRTGVKYIKMNCTWPVEEYADYIYDLNNPANIIRLDPTLVTGDIDFVITDQSNVGFDDTIYTVIGSDLNTIVDSNGDTIVGSWVV